MITQPTISRTLGELHRRELTARADAYRLARSASNWRRRRPGCWRLPGLFANPVNFIKCVCRTATAA